MCWVIIAAILLQGMFALNSKCLVFQGAFTGGTVEISAVDSPVVLKATDAASGECLNSCLWCIPVERVESQGQGDKTDKICLM